VEHLLDYTSSVALYLAWTLEGRAREPAPPGGCPGLHAAEMGDVLAEVKRVLERVRALVKSS